ncbi:MAG: phage portal protein [Tannerellaceae bacterium]|nr:phage portal protein [Tannerellaceae bacterium]
MKIEQIVSSEIVTHIIDELKSKRYYAQPDIEKAKKGLDPLLHDVFDPLKRPDKTVKVDAEDGGTKKVITTEESAIGLRKEPVARIAIAIQKLIVKRAVAFLFGNPVELEAEADNDNQKAVLKALKRILYDIKSDSFNRKIARQVFSCTEVAEYWYPVPVAKTWTGKTLKNKVTDFFNNIIGNKYHLTYGFKTGYKLKAAIFSPLLGDTLYPYFDEGGDMIAFSREFTRTDEKNVARTFFETYTDEEQMMWELTGDGIEEVEGYPRKIEIGKIPIVYGRQSELEWQDVQVLIDRLEKLLSNFADTNDYHASPKIFVKGELLGFAKKGESGAIIQGDKDAEASYLAWQHAPESVKLEIETLLRLIYTLTQTPDIAFDSVKGIGAVSGVALKLLFMDAHLKAADKMEIFDEYLQRRVNIIKAFIGKMNTQLAIDADNLVVEPEITPYMIEDEKTRIDLLVTANGGKPVVSQQRSVELAGLANDAEEDFKQIESEAEKEMTFTLGEPTIA